MKNSMASPLSSQKRIAILRGVSTAAVGVGSLSRVCFLNLGHVNLDLLATCPAALLGAASNLTELAHEECEVYLDTAVSELEDSVLKAFYRICDVMPSEMQQRLIPGYEQTSSAARGKGSLEKKKVVSIWLGKGLGGLLRSLMRTTIRREAICGEVTSPTVGRSSRWTPAAGAVPGPKVEGQHECTAHALVASGVGLAAWLSA
jgi:hypothetical protein